MSEEAHAIFDGLPSTGHGELTDSERYRHVYSRKTWGPWNMSHPCQVRELLKILGQAAPPRVQVVCDAWGLRKFMSHYIRRFNSTSRSPATCMTYNALGLYIHAVHGLAKN